MKTWTIILTKNAVFLLPLAKVSNLIQIKNIAYAENIRVKLFKSWGEFLLKISANSK